MNNGKAENINININQGILNEKNYKNRYARKIISVTENENQVFKHRYGVVNESIYYTESECDCVNCFGTTCGNSLIQQVQIKV